MVLAGPPTCGVRLLPDVDIPGDLNPDSHCAREGDTWRLLVNARWLPFVIAHGVLDELVPLPSVLYRCTSSTGSATATGSPSIRSRTTSPGCSRTSSTIRFRTWAPGPRQGDPGHITFAWYPQLVRPDLGIGPHRVWWLSELTADPDTTATRGATASVDARSHARPDPTRTTRRRRGFEPDLDLSPGLYTELVWRIGPAVDPLPSLALHLTRVAGLTVDVARAGLPRCRVDNQGG